MSRRGRSPLFEPLPNCAYLAFNKPYNVLCQFSTPSESDKRTLAEFGFPPDVYSIGRLDYDSEGLLILSDDARLNHSLLDPSHGHERSYFVQVENIPQPEQLKQLMSGVVIQGKKTLPCRVALLPAPPPLGEREVPIRFRASIPTAWIRLTLSEGRNRQVRRMTAAVGCPTLRLVRASIGKLSLADLAIEPGQWCKLGREQVQACFERNGDG